MSTTLGLYVSVYLALYLLNNRKPLLGIFLHFLLKALTKDICVPAHILQKKPIFPELKFD